MIARLFRRLRDWLVPGDPAWQPTTLKFTTARDYDQDHAAAKAKSARQRSATGRKYQGPKKQQAKAPAAVVRIDSRRVK